MDARIVIFRTSDKRGIKSFVDEKLFVLAFGIQFTSKARGQGYGVSNLQARMLSSGRQSVYWDAHDNRITFDFRQFNHLFPLSIHWAQHKSLRLGLFNSGVEAIIEADDVLAVRVHT